MNSVFAKIFSLASIRSNTYVLLCIVFFDSCTCSEYVFPYFWLIYLGYPPTVVFPMCTQSYAVPNAIFEPYGHSSGFIFQPLLHYIVLKWLKNKNIYTTAVTNVIC